MAGGDPSARKHSLRSTSDETGAPVRGRRQSVLPCVQIVSRPPGQFLSSASANPIVQHAFIWHRSFRSDTDLLHQPQLVRNLPLINDLATLQAIDGNLPDRDGPAGGRDPKYIAFVRSGESEHANDFLSNRHQLV